MCKKAPICLFPLRFCTNSIRSWRHFLLKCHRNSKFHNKQKNTRACPPLKDVKMIAYDYLCEGVKQNRYSSPYISQFTSLPAFKEYRKLEIMRKFLNGRYLKKEITECMSVVNRCLSLLYELRTKLEKVKTILLFDLCSGKGYTGVCLHALLPEDLKHKTRIIMLDKNAKMRMEHLQVFSKEEVCFEPFCIFTEDKDGKNRLIRDMENRIAQFGKPGEDVVAFCLGIHLCVHLSEMFIDLFNNVESIWAMILSPCCHKENIHNSQFYEMSRTSIFEDDDSEEKLKKNNVFTIEHIQYMLWTLYLYNKIETQVKRIVHDVDVMSPRNNYLVACKMLSQLPPDASIFNWNEQQKEALNEEQ